ncbi:MAG: 4Fe-4S dicluster domain-containing protein [Ruminococcaceae bacterium]|nr:4Fe-4S dicluster domain-containing protein [Oscillospiraceae bacterium]
MEIGKVVEYMAIFPLRGLRLPALKAPAAERAVEEPDALSRVYLPLSYGGDTRLTLHQYSSVLYGQAVAAPKDKKAPPILSSVSGVYTAKKDLSHPVYGEITCLVMDCMDVRRPAPAERVDVTALSAQQILEVAREHAVMDELDGRYLCDKLREWAATGCDLLVGDAVEDQPYASAAWAVLGESVESVYEGLTLAARACGAGDCHLAVQPLPADHRRALRQRLGDDKKLFITRGKYPTVHYTAAPKGKTVCRIGVQALLALYRAAAFHEPHTTCVVTVAGDAVAAPRNLRVPFGTPASELLQRCGLIHDPTVLVFGDMMTGKATEDAEMPVLPGVTCLLALNAPARPAADVCAGCGRCVQVCHAGLLPEAIVQRLEKGQNEYVIALHPEMCDNCGACSAVCPAGRDLAMQIATVAKVIAEGGGES